MIRSGEKRAVLKSLLAILLVIGCLWASQWQFHRGQDRSARNATIEAHIDIPAVDLVTLKSSVKKNEWRAITTTGTFDADQQILLRNRYFEGKYEAGAPGHLSSYNFPRHLAVFRADHTLRGSLCHGARAVT